MDKSQIRFNADDDYAGALLDVTRNVKRRLLLETMVLDDDGAMNEVLASAAAARRRGAQVILIFDRYTYFETFIRERRGGVRRFNNLLADLEESGVETHKVGERHLNPFAGRNHMKAVVADDVAFIGGGVNLTGRSFSSKDFMVQIDDARVADTLFEALPVFSSDKIDDEVLMTGEDYKILADGGRPGQSLIYDTVCNLASEAKRVWYVSKLAPDGRLLKLLESTDTTYWHNSFDTAGAFDRLAIAIDQFKHQVDNSYKHDELLHAKFMVFEMPGGHLELVSGSHNFNSRGVNFGTKELALWSSNQALAKRLVSFADSL